jgi:hypothetical protein
MKSLFAVLFILGVAVTTTGQNGAHKQSLSISRSGEVTLENSTDGNSIATGVREMPKQGLSPSDGVKKSSFHFPKRATVNFSTTTNDFAPSLMVREMPRQREKKMEIYNYPESKSAIKQAVNDTLPVLAKGKSFMGNPFGIATPNDNDFAMSDSILVSVMNTNILIKNINTNTTMSFKTLAAFTTPVNSFHQEFDPKVIYDPLMKRFVLVTMVGSVDSTSKIIVGFSQTGNPAGNWNLYTLPGDALGNNLWSDYPMIAMTENELFLTVNLLYNDSTWQAGFVETIVWQIRKANGYAGDSLAADLHSNIKFNGKAIRNLCPVKGGSKLYSPNMYFLSNRNLASQNDTVFLVNITDTIGAPTTTITTKALITPQPYYFPKDGRQTIASQSLATNDCRNLGAFYENNMIQYVHNTNNPSNNRATVYYGVLSNPQSATPTITGYIIPNDTMDFAYPNISYSGKTVSDSSAIINFNHSSNKVFPGVSAIQADAKGNFSPILRIQNGATYINLLTSNLERWGDYSGSQRRYNVPGEVWISGYYGVSGGFNYPRAHAAWIAQLYTFVDTVDYTSIDRHSYSEEGAEVFPNPAIDIFSVDISLSKPEYLSFELYDIQGKQIAVLLRDWVRVKQNVFSFRTSDLSKGVYFLKIRGNYDTQITKKIIIQ